MWNNFFGSKLNTILLLILIVLMVFALRIMLKDKETYLPVLTQSAEKYFVGEITDKDNGCWTDGNCAIEINDEYWVTYNQGKVVNPLPVGNLEGPLDIGSKVEVFAKIVNREPGGYTNQYTIVGDEKYYIKLAK